MGDPLMPPAARRKTSPTLDAAALDEARALGLGVSAVADAALQGAIARARRHRWLEETADGFAAQADWHARNGHPLADIMVFPARSS